jgi:copper homeostasis protein
MNGLLEVTVLHARDVPGAQEGGADRLFVVSDGDRGGLSPEPALVQHVCRETDLPVRVMLRLNDSWTTSGGEFTRLVGLAEDFMARGAEGVAFGFLDSDLEVDARTCLALVDALPGVPRTFSPALDATLDPRSSWRRIFGLPGLDSVRSAGSPRELDLGFDDLLTTARSDERIPPILMPGGGLTAEQVPWFVRAGVRQFHLGSQARPGASHKAYVDAAHVRSYRLLVDDTVQRAG